MDCDQTNECICRADLQADADVKIRSCVSSYCKKNEQDMASAVSIYDAYCTGAGFFRASAVAQETGAVAAGTISFIKFL